MKVLPTVYLSLLTRNALVGMQTMQLTLGENTKGVSKEGVKPPL